MVGVAAVEEEAEVARELRSEGDFDVEMDGMDSDLHTEAGRHTGSDSNL